MTLDGAKHPVIILRERVYLFKLSFGLWVHVLFILTPMCPQPELNQHLPLRTGLFYPLNYRGRTLRGDAKSRHDPLLVETDDHIRADENDRHSHLARLLNHFLALLEVVSNVEFGVSNALLLQEILGHLAEVAGRGAINGNLLVHVLNIIYLVYHS